ncbi:cysteine dioxygenase family protein [Rossellomorea aquimaris]|uniref:cysteine dioxygenase n=1 Tax=Rossellomorea aquimaris TaxID=189382 RepID=UPI001CD6EF1E|nr:cysteine dioxygenase family protein [Rossellomorea aquimaris]MCA1056343.1 cysteine dioxygenase family protein [Rossellomorea aquimaris]
MTMYERIKERLDGLVSPSNGELRSALESLSITLEELAPLLRTSSGKPYYRRLLYQNEEVELLVMNWSDIECAPHDHGDSKGWIKVMGGSSLNTVFEVDDGHLPKELFNKVHHKGSYFFAPRNGIHKMKREGNDPLVTLHLYSPPIEGMKVYDLEKCAACIVSKECGAWWPDDQKQKLEEMMLDKD